MAEPATEKQLALLKQRTGKDYSEFNLTKSEASRKIDELMGDKKEDKPAPKRDTSTNDSIEIQVAFKGIIELAATKVLSMKDAKVLAAMNWAMSKLGNWASSPIEQPSPNGETEQSSEPMATVLQLKKIYATAQERGYTDSLAVAIMVRLYGTGHSKQLTKVQASDFIKVLEAGKYLEDLSKETHPEDLPF